MSAKADKLYKDAESKANSFTWFGISKEKNCEEAAELYIKAAAQFKISKDFMQAGLAYEKAAECNMSANNEIEANNNWRESGKCYRHVDTDKAINAYRNAIQFYLNSDRFSQAARLAEEIADMMSEDDKFEEAMKSYEEAANYFTTENDPTNANKRLEKMAMMATKVQQYEKAIPVFEKIAKTNVDNNLLRWNVKNYLFRASICVINKKIVNNDGKFWLDVSNAFQKYQNISDLFASAREAKLIESIIEALKNLNVKAFKDAVSEFDSLNPLDSWTTEQLLVMEKYLREKKIEAPNLISDDNDEKNNAPNNVNVDDGWNENDNNDNNNDNEQEKEQVKVYDPLKGAPSLNNAPDLEMDG